MDCGSKDRCSFHLATQLTTFQDRPGQLGINVYWDHQEGNTSNFRIKSTCIVLVVSSFLNLQCFFQAQRFPKSVKAVRVDCRLNSSPPFSVWEVLWWRLWHSVCSSHSGFCTNQRCDETLPDPNNNTNMSHLKDGPRPCALFQSRLDTLK